MKQHDEDTKMTKFFELLGAFVGVRKVYCDADFSNYRSAGVAMHIVDNKYISFCYRLDYDDFKEQFNNDMDEDQDNDEETQEKKLRTCSIEMPLPNKDKTVIGPEIFNRLSMSFNTISKAVPYNFFKYALVNCPNLSYFEASLLIDALLGVTRFVLLRPKGTLSLVENSILLAKLKITSRWSNYWMVSFLIKPCWI